MSLAIGDCVRLVKLEEWFLANIEEDAVEYLRSLIGVETKLIGFDHYGHVELEFLRSNSPHTMHTVWVDPSWIEKV